jgi:FAD/FMN-containing dehydrogenase/Fe-S oxidoreductase
MIFAQQDLNVLMTLRAKLGTETTAEVRFDASTRAVYASEASNYRQLPIGVVIPRTISDVVTAVRLCREAGLPILPRGAGTSMCGQAVNAAMVMDTSKYLNAITSIDPVQRIAWVQPGVICDQLKGEAAKVGLTFGPDPATHSRCTLGGMIGNNSCGAHSVMAGKTVENVEKLEILTYCGERFWVGPTNEASYQEHLAAGGRRAEIVKGLRTLVDEYEDEIREEFPKLKRRVSGYNLDQLLPENGFNIARALVGVEGTCVTVLQAQTLLVKNPTHRVLIVLGFDDIYQAADSAPHLLPLSPIAMEGLDDGIIGGLKERGMKLDEIAELPGGNAWLMVEFGAQSQEDATVMAQEAVRIAPGLPGRPSVRLITDGQLMNRIWTIRETGASATSLCLDPNSPDPVVGWEDAAVEPEHLGKYLRDFKKVVSKYGYKTNLYGHFGDGCIHSRITFDLKSKSGIADWRAFLNEAAHLVVRYGGSLSGEHGDGQAKGEYLRIMYSDRIMGAFAEFKNLWDPLNRMNPGKLIHAMPVDANLRMGPDYHRKDVASQFTYDSRLGDKGLAREAERCIGMGKCRSLEGGTMCPSFRATREEKYSTRGRARLFFELLKGEVIEDGWRNEEIKDSLDLCLSCKGCKTDCPTNVDIARYKTEFLSRYYEHKRRPIMDMTIAHIGSWLPYATKYSAVLNYAMRNPAVRAAGSLVGLAKGAKFPQIAKASFRDGRTAKRLIDAENSTAKGVLLWVDSFNNGFTPQVLEAGVEFLEALGFSVQLMKRHICCGRPFYDSGMLDQARSNLLQILDQLAPALDQAMPVVVLEPSCLSVFRDEMPALLPENTQAQQLKRSIMTLSEFIQQQGVTLPDINQDVRIHGHCHQKSCGGMGGEQGVLSKLGGKGKVIAAGCCGLAGAYGYHAKTAPIAKIIGEKEFKPVIDAIPDSIPVVADGFSCRGQIRNVCGREPLHLAEYLSQVLTSQDVRKEG